MSTTAIVVLAAGTSRRFGSLKQLQKLRGHSLVRRAAATAVQIDVPVYVVIGAQEPRVMSELFGLPVTCVENPDWERGMGSSLAIGVRKARADLDPDAVVVMLADQPLVTPEHIRTLLAEFMARPDHIVATDYGNEVMGPPCVFPSTDFPALVEQDGDRGARALLIRNAKRVRRVPLAHAAIDVDTPDDLARASTALEASDPIGRFLGPAGER